MKRKETEASSREEVCHLDMTYLKAPLREKKLSFFFGFQNYIN